MNYTRINRLYETETMNQNRSHLRSIIIAAIVMIGTISAAYAAPIDILVSGQVVYDDGSVCNNPTVDVVNLDTGDMGIVVTNESLNDYSTTLYNVSINDTLQFTATSPDERPAASAPGVYNVTVVATDDSANGNSATDDMAAYTVQEDPGDITPPEILSVAINPEEVYVDGSITVTVTATDDSGISSVTADGIELSSVIADGIELVLVANDTYEGMVPAASAPGVYNVTVVATDASDNNNTATGDLATYEARIPVTLSIKDVTIGQGMSEIVPIMVFDVVDMGGCEINFVYDPTVVYVTDVTRGDMNFSFEYNINNGSGWMRANALDVNGVSGDVVFTYITLTAVGNKDDISEMEFEASRLVDASFGEIAHITDGGMFSIVSNVLPEVTNISATPDTILYDNGRPRALGTDLTLLSARVTDADGSVAEVTIDLSSIGGLVDQQMTHVSGDLWEVTTNATEVAINAPDFINQLTITATDNDGGISDPASLELIVLKRGDVNGDGLVNKMDADYISRYLAGLEPEVPILVGDVVGEAGEPTGNGVVDLMDALYIAKYTEGMVGAP